MKSFLTIVGVLLAAATVCTANAIEPVEDRVTCAETTYDQIKAHTLRLIGQYSDQLEALRGNYTACNALPTGGQREECHLEYGRHVVNVLLGLRTQLDTIKTEVLRFALAQLDSYVECRDSSITSSNATLYCAVLAYEEARDQIAPLVANLRPRLEKLREGITTCYYGFEAQKANCYYQLLLKVRLEVNGFITNLEKRREVYIGAAIDLLDDYFSCRVEHD